MLQGRILRLAQALLIAIPSFTLYGYIQVGVGSLTSFENFTRVFPDLDTVHAPSAAAESRNSLIEGVYVASCTLGAAVGSLYCFLVGDVLSRRVSIFLGALLIFIGGLLSSTAFQLPQLFIGRILSGTGIGIIATSVPVWQSECSRAVNRGQHVVVDGISVSAGYMISNWVNYGLWHIQEHQAGWRVSQAIPSAIAIAPIVSIFFLSESPRWLLRVGRKTEAARELSLIRGYDIDSAEIKEELASIEFSLAETKQSTASVKDIFTMKDGKYFFRFMLIIGVQFWMQLSGTSVITTYATTIFKQDLQLSGGLSRILASCVLTSKFIASFFPFFTIDRLGRRTSFLIAGVGTTIGMLALGVTVRYASTSYGAAIGSVFFSFFYSILFPIGFLGPTYLYTTEVVPTRLRMTMTSISTFQHWLWYTALWPRYSYT